MTDAKTVAGMMDAVEAMEPGPERLHIRCRAWPELTLAMKEYEELINRLEKYIGSPVESHRARLAALREALEGGT